MSARHKRRRRGQRPHIAARRRLKQEAARRHGCDVSLLEWREGQLYFRLTDLAVEGVPIIRKPDIEVADRYIRREAEKARASP